MFLNLQQKKTVEWLISILEAQGYRVSYPEIEGYDKTDVREIRWSFRKNDEPVGHITFQKILGKPKLAIYEPTLTETAMCLYENYWRFLDDTVLKGITVPSSIKKDNLATWEELKGHFD